MARTWRTISDVLNSSGAGRPPRPANDSLRLESRRPFPHRFDGDFEPRFHEAGSPRESARAFPPATSPSGCRSHGRRASAPAPMFLRFRDPDSPRLESVVDLTSSTSRRSSSRQRVSSSCPERTVFATSPGRRRHEQVIDPGQVHGLDRRSLLARARQRRELIGMMRKHLLIEIPWMIRIGCSIFCITFCGSKSSRLLNHAESA